MRYFFRVEYDGSAYCGWQRQPNGLSVQEALERALRIVVRQECTVVGAGRTDAGVHARRQGAHVEVAATLDPRVCERSLNALLPTDIAVSGLRPVAGDFHARFSAVERRYSYYVVRRKSPLCRAQAWHMTYPMDWERTAAQLTCLAGTHDFAAFCASGSDCDGTLCTMKHAALEQRGEQWVFSLWANRFVYRMVRSIVGTVVDIGRGACAEGLESILAGRERDKAGPTAPAAGLVLEDVIYPDTDE